jgi:hypothetical protein
MIWLYPEKASMKVSNRCPAGRVYKLIDSRQGEAIFWASLVKVCEVYAHSPFAVGLFHHDDIG